MRSVPAAELRGLTKAGSPSRSRSSFTRWKAASGITTSPRTSNALCGRPAFFRRSPEMLSGTLRMVRMFEVTSSPVWPSPRVSPMVSHASPSGPGW